MMLITSLPVNLFMYSLFIDMMMNNRCSAVQCILVIIKVMCTFSSGCNGNSYLMLMLLLDLQIS